jgi:hypothetical protein
MDIYEVKKELVDANEEISTCELNMGIHAADVTDSFRPIDRSTTICPATETLLRYYRAGGQCLPICEEGCSVDFKSLGTLYRSSDWTEVS